MYVLVYYTYMYMYVCTGIIIYTYMYLREVLSPDFRQACILLSIPGTDDRYVLSITALHLM